MTKSNLLQKTIEHHDYKSVPFEVILDEDYVVYNSVDHTMHPCWRTLSTCCVGNMLGFARFCLNDYDKVIACILPISPRDGNYEIIAISQIETYKSIVQAYTNSMLSYD